MIEEHQSVNQVGVLKVMKRRNFLKVTLAALPLSAAAAQPAETPNQGFFVASSDDRFHEHIKLGGTTPHHCKVSGKDTDGAFCVFELGPTSEGGGEPRHFHETQDEWLFVLDGEFQIEVANKMFNLKAG